MDSPKVSVIIPCYNSERFIRETLESVLCQTYNNLEIIVVDDGSTDNTRVIVNSFSDPRIKYFYKKNGGVSIARNYGIELSKGEYIAFLDSDDLWLAEKIELQVKKIEEENAHLIYSGFYLIDGKDRVLGEFKFKRSSDISEDLLLKGNIIGPPSGVLVKKEVFENVGNFDPALSTSADWDLWIRIASRYPMVCINKLLFKYRNHNANMHSNIETMKRDVDKTLHKFFRNLSSENKLNRIKKRSISNLYMTIAKSYFKKKNFIAFLRTVLICFFYCPSSILNLIKDIWNKLLLEVFKRIRILKMSIQK